MKVSSDRDIKGQFLPIKNYISLQVTNSMVKLLFFCFLVTNSKLNSKKFNFELLTWWVHFYFLIFWVLNEKLINKKNLLIIAVSKWHGLHHSIAFFVFSLLCCKKICDIYLSILDGLMAYATSTTRNSVAVSQRRNDHMQFYIIAMVSKYKFFIQIVY